MKYILFILMALRISILCAQTEELKKFYPENSLYRQLKVKTVTDSFMIVPGNSRITEYDSLGRELQSYYAGCLKCSSPYTYLTRGDTLFRLQYYRDSVKTWLHSYEAFVYSRSKKIIRYSYCRQPFHYDKGFYAQVNRFFYDESDSLTCLLAYSSHDYQQPVSAAMTIAETDLTLTDVIYYTYQKQPNTRLVIGKHAIGNPDWRATDSFTYNRHNQLIRVGSFAKRGFVGELGYANLNRVTEYDYQPGVVTEWNYHTSCLIKLPNGDCADPYQSDMDKGEIILKPNGLPEIKYSFYQPGEKLIVSKYYYSYYK